MKTTELSESALAFCKVFILAAMLLMLGKVLALFVGVWFDIDWLTRLGW